MSATRLLATFALWFFAVIGIHATCIEPGLAVAAVILIGMIIER